MTAKVTYCPVGDFSCPYYGARGACLLENPAEECDDYYAMIGDDEDEDLD